MANPSTFQEAQKEVDMVIGTGPITVDHMSKLPYIQACLREALRLNPTASTISLHPSPNNTEDPILIGGGQYLIKPGKSLRMLMPKIHCDPQIYGDDAELFRPERMLDENFEKLPKNAWKVSPTIYQLLFGVTGLLLMAFNLPVMTFHNKASRSTVPPLNASLCIDVSSFTTLWLRPVWR